MNIDNITSEDMTLTYNGIAMQIKVYEGEIERLHSIIKEARKYIKDIQNSMWHDDKEVLNRILEILDKANKEE